MICALIPSNPFHLSRSRPSHRGTEAAATHGAPELSKGLLGSVCSVEAFSQQHDAVEEEEGRQTIDDILEILDAEENIKFRVTKKLNILKKNLENPMTRGKKKVFP